VLVYVIEHHLLTLQIDDDHLEQVHLKLQAQQHCHGLGALASLRASASTPPLNVVADDVGFCQAARRMIQKINHLHLEHIFMQRNK
jgi:hypothetical protein